MNPTKNCVILKLLQKSLHLNYYKLIILVFLITSRGFTQVRKFVINLFDLFFLGAVINVNFKCDKIFV